MIFVIRANWVMLRASHQGPVLFSRGEGMGFQNGNTHTIDILEAMGIEIPRSQEGNLLQAVLVRALLDIVLPAATDRKWRRSAARWFFDPPKTVDEKHWPLSLDNLCSHLEICPDLIRNRLIQHYPQKVREARFGKSKPPVHSGLSRNGFMRTDFPVLLRLTWPSPELPPSAIPPFRLPPLPLPPHSPSARGQSRLWARLPWPF